jgi:hypothetical protein
MPGGANPGRIGRRTKNATPPVNSMDAPVNPVADAISLRFVTGTRLSPEYGY